MLSQPTRNICLHQWSLCTRHFLSILKGMTLAIQSLSSSADKEEVVMRRANSKLVCSMFINQLDSEQEVGF